MKEPSIITAPNPKLSEVTGKVTSFVQNSDELKDQIKKMVATLRKEGGIGLAANQLGYNNQVLAIEYKEIDKKTSKKRTEIPLTVFINPEIIEYGKTLECFEEGCLSVPKIELEVERPTQIKIKYQDEKGKKIKAAPKGLVARILQHEVDHINGTLFTDRVKSQFFQNYPEFKKLHIAFFGSGEFAAIILEGLILLGLNLDIYTEPSKPSGRGQESKPTPVGEVTEKFSRKFHEITSFESLIFNFDLLICADFGQKIPDSILKQAKIVALNLHPSLLPKYIGPTPIQNAILNGDKVTGVSLIKMTQQIDKGPIYSQIETELMGNETTPLLRDRLATLGMKLLVKSLPKIVREEIEAVEQDLSKAKRTYKFDKADGEINWRISPKAIERQIRAFFPWPGTYTEIDGKRLIIHEAHSEKDKLAFDIVQLEGKKPMKFKEFLRGYRGSKPDWFEKLSLT